VSLYQRDYILRVIEQLAQVLIVLRNRILGREGEPSQLHQEIRSIASRVGLDLQVARAVDPTILRMLMSQAGTLDPGRCWLMAELLFLEALQARGNGEAAQAARDIDRALLLHGWNEPEWQPFPELPPVSERMDEFRALRAELDADLSRQ
jgi:hypothetical protein